MSNLKWSYNEFLAFLLIYISHVDMDFSDEEKDYIRIRVGDETYNKMFVEFDSMTDFQALETILSYKGVYYPTPEQKQELIDKMIAIFNTDMNFNIMERGLLHFMERMM